MANRSFKVTSGESALVLIAGNDDYYPGTEEAHTNPDAPARGVPQSPRWRVGLTHRAALGGPLTARELFFRRIGLPPWLVFILLYFTAARVSGPIYSGAYCPWVSMAREAWSLSLVTCHAGFSRRGIDPVGETANVNEPPLGSRRLVVSSLAVRRAGDNRGSFYKK